MNGKFLTDVRAIRERARKHMEQGAVTSSFKADKDSVVKVLNDALATEIVCVLRYKFHYYQAHGMQSKPVAEEFKEHAENEQTHVDQIAERIAQLGGKPDFSPELLSKRSFTEYKDTEGLIEMIKEDLIAERIVIDSYQEVIRWLGDRDPSTRRLVEGILSDEEEHAHDLQNLLAGVETHARH